MRLEPMRIPRKLCRVDERTTDMTDSIVDWPVDDLTVERRANLKRDLLAELTRQNRRQRRLHVVTGAVVATTAASATIAMVVSTSPTATAAWSAVPVPLAISLNDPMVLQCLAELPAEPSSQVGRSALTPLVAESRGTSRAALLEGNDSQGVCIATPTSRSGGRTLAPPLTAGLDITLAGNGGSTDPSGSRYVYGRVSSRVASVAVTTTSGLHVTSSVAHGAYLAWWPDGKGPEKIIALDADGDVIAAIRPKPE